METLLHNQIKNQIAAVLTRLISQGRMGLYCGDRMRLVNVAADISCEPDGMFVSRAARRAGRVTWEEGPESLEVIGSPDMVLGVVRSSSVQKDTVVLRELYSRAQVREYWLVNPLGGTLAFDILRNIADGHVAAPKAGGWIKSAVFRRSFRLAPQKIAGELPQFKLHVRK